MQRSVTSVAGGCSINFDRSHPGMAFMKIRLTCSFLLSSAACNLTARTAVSPSKRACSALSPAPPSPGALMLQLLADLALGRHAGPLFVSSVGSFRGCLFLGQIAAVLI